MSSDTLKTRAIIQEANEWLLKMTEPRATPQDEAGFAPWLRQSPVHVREFLRAEAVYAAMAGIDPERRIDVQALLAEDAANVVALGQVGVASGEGRSNVPASRAGVLEQQDVSPSSEPMESAHSARGDEGGMVLAAASRAGASPGEECSRGRLAISDGDLRSQDPRAGSPRRMWATAASIVLAIAAGAALYIQSTAPELYVTARGEQRRLVLEDGSVIDMNTETELSVRMDDDGRHVNLMKGEALFSVAKDPARPFVVATDAALIEAVGTAFNVRSITEDVTVTVVEGIVDVTSRSFRLRSGQVGWVAGEDEAAPAPGVLEPVRLKVGQQAKIESRSGQVAVIDTTIEKAIAWQERRLIFENQPLSEVAAEFNRYNRRQLVIDDASLAQTRISAVFDADQPEALVRFLTKNTPIKVVDNNDTRLILRAND